MDVELDPPQPEPIARAVEALLVDADTEPDPWWKDGINDVLGDG